MGDTEGPVYEAMQAELKRARSAVQMQPAWRSHQLRGQDIWRRPLRRVALIQEAKAYHDRRTGLMFPVQCQQEDPTITPKLRCNAKVGVGSFTTHGAHVGGGSGDDQTNH